MQLSGTSPSPAVVRVYDGSSLRSKLDAVLGDQSIPINEVPDRMNEISFHSKLPVARETGGKPSGDATIDRVFDNASTVNAFLQSRFGRNGWDAKGGALEVKAHFPSDNANWEYTDNSFWVGDSGIGPSLGNALDIMAHEVAHGIYKSEVYTTDAEAQAHAPSVWSRAVDESFADVFAAQVDADDWTMAEDVGDPTLVRDLEHPKFATVADVPMDRVIDPNAGSSSRITLPKGAQPIGEHDLSGIASLAAVRTAEKLGREQMGDVWYKALTEHLRADDGFEGAALATLEAATDLFGAGSTQSAAIDQAWRSVGVTPATTHA
jgi:Zn-dependent metalloprotease